MASYLAYPRIARSAPADSYDDDAPLINLASLNDVTRARALTISIDDASQYGEDSDSDARSLFPRRKRDEGLTQII